MNDDNVSDDIADVLGFGFRFPSNLAFERLHMTRRALNHLMRDDVLPTRESFGLIKITFRDKRDLTLEFPEGFDAPFADPATEKTFLEKLKEKDKGNVNALRGIIKETNASILRRLEEAEKRLGAFEFNVGTLCKKLTELGGFDNKNVIAFMNKMLGDKLDVPIPNYTVETAKYPLATAIAAHYRGERDPLGTFLADIQTKMGGTYPLNNDEITIVKVDKQALAESNTLINGRFRQTATEANITLLVQALKFNGNQKKQLRFFACHEKEHIIHLLQAVQPTADSLEHHINALALVLDMKPDVIKHELRPGSDIVRYGFLAYDDAACSFQVDKSLTKILRGNHKSKEELIAGLLGPSPKSELQPVDYDYTDNFIRMKASLRGLVKGKEPAIAKTMTLYGPRGTGKSEMTSVLAKDMNIPAFLVGVAQIDDDTATVQEPSRAERIKDLIRKAYIIGQTQMDAFLVLDEADGLLDQEVTHDKGSKAFINYVLENMDVPLVLIFNDPEKLEEATKRRTLPAFKMDYMPLDARMSKMITKIKRYTGMDLDEPDVKPLAQISRKMSIAEIDRCIGTAANLFKQTVHNGSNDVLIEAIHREFISAQAYFNNGITPVPPRITRRKGDLFYPELVSALGLVKAQGRMKAVYQKDPGVFARQCIVVAGPPGSGKLTSAEFFATITGRSPIIVPMNGDEKNNPDNAYVADLEASASERTPLILTGAGDFLTGYSSDHSLARNIARHSQLTFLVGNADQELRHLHNLHVFRTAYLTEQQLEFACEKILQVKLDPGKLSGCSGITIGNIVNIRDGLAMTGQLGDNEATIEQIRQCSTQQYGTEPTREPASLRAWRSGISTVMTNNL